MPTIHDAWLIPLLPLIGAAVAGLLGARWLRGHSHLPIWVTVGTSALLSIVLLAQVWDRTHYAQWQRTYKVGTRTEVTKHAGPYTLAQPDADKSIMPASRKDTIEAGKAFGERVHLWTWIESGTFTADAAFWIDPLTVVMLCVVTGIGFLITIFAAGYMKGERGYFRFFAYLGLFIFMMTILVMGDNFVMLYLGWEGVGLCSYLLIGYYYEKPAAREAAKKAFLVNRIGDFGFGLGIMLIYLVFGTVSYFVAPDGGPGALTQAFAQQGQFSGWKAQAVQWIPFLLMLGAFGKSAQFPLYVWLPDAMEGPTPVSALIHAATMVTAGVYMIVRCGTLFVGVPAAMTTIAVIGAFTALFAATIALRQFDLKKVFAYSTISQLGFMFVAAGALAPIAAVFHLATHAFFKALLFLSSGVVMHAMLGHLDMRKMSGLKRVLPWTNVLMLIGCLALAGVPLFSGFFSKDEIVIYAWERSPLLGSVMLLTALLTAYYTFRLYFRVFQGPTVVPAAPADGHHAPEDHGAADAHAHASASAVRAGDAHHSGVDHGAAHHGGHPKEPMLMIAPLILLALGAIFAGYINWPEWHGREVSLGHFLRNSPSLIYSYEMALKDRERYIVPPTAYGYEEDASKRVEDATDSSHRTLMIASGLIALLGIYLAYELHLKYRQRGEQIPRRFPWASRLLEAKYWVDEIYQAAIVNPLRQLGRALAWIDDWIVDGLISILGFAPQVFGYTLKLGTQRGSLQGYAVSMLLLVALILVLIFVV